jgi:hypothetical protein
LLGGLALGLGQFVELGPDAFTLAIRRVYSASLGADRGQCCDDIGGEDGALVGGLAGQCFTQDDFRV